MIGNQSVVKFKTKQIGKTIDWSNLDNQPLSKNRSLFFIPNKSNLCLLFNV
jgi:hypothetical protein